MPRQLLLVIERGIRMDWKDINDDSERPPWMRQVYVHDCPLGVACLFVKPTSYITEILQAV